MYRQAVQLALSCVTDAVIVIHSFPHGAPQSGSIFSLVLNSGDPVRLRGATTMALNVSQTFTLEPHVGHGTSGWYVTTTGYRYVLSDSGNHEILAFHWHPQGHSFVTFPHMHIGAVMISSTAPARSRDFHHAHVPTGTVLLEDVARFVINEMAVRSRRDDWETALQQAIVLREQVS